MAQCAGPFPPLRQRWLRTGRRSRLAGGSCEEMQCVDNTFCCSFLQLQQQLQIDWKLHPGI
ncbi:Hypothetical predicted protein [Podarcis lilfordi]|uniref:Uncharacterized protein n=1 Tax=Podarcis lilfordi TaxID=74358 RepID=A0AA35JRK2_9SAUR|nr:Hypothetical predicted protein [Podarcis lilfordi]